jgi:excisionase family DNA binding protein
MPIASSVLDERRLTMDQAARYLGIGVSTVRTYCHEGYRGVTLEHARCGRRIYTSREACQRFIAALARQEGGAR